MGKNYVRFCFKKRENVRLKMIKNGQPIRVTVHSDLR